MPSNLGVPPGYPDYAREGMAGEMRSYSDIPKKIPPSEFPDALNKRLIHGYHASVSYMDHNVGLLLEALHKSREADNTIVIFWGDHGWKLGDHSSWCKHTNFECDTRVPLIVRVPGKPSAKGTTNSLVELVDLYPTLCDLTGLEKPAHLQGRSFLPTLDDPKTAHREFAYSSYRHGRNKDTPVTGHSLRTAQYRYTEWWERSTDKVVAKALTDLAADPGESSSALPDKKNDAERLSNVLRTRVLEVRKK